MKMTKESETCSLSKSECADLKYYLYNIRNILLNFSKNNNKEVRDINVGVGLFNIDKALEILI